MPIPKTVVKSSVYHTRTGRFLGAASEESLLAWPTLAERSGQAAEAATALERALELMPGSAPVRLQWLAAHSRRLILQVP